MKLITLLCATVFVLCNATQSYSQEKKQEIRKEFKMEEVNGKKKLTIVTTDNGKVTEEVLEGEAAEAKLAELMQQQPLVQEEIKQEVDVIEHDGKKTVTILTTKNGTTTKEVYTGNDAEKKLKELGTIEMTQEKIVVEETVIKKKKKRKKKSKH
ncbi:MAG: hypothetical protein ACPGVI_00925 [Crocinitomicaceae bacterium]